MPDLHEAWERIHAGDWGEATRTPSRFASLVSRELRPSCRVLELGCGRGVDAAYFAGQGHEVIATDFVEAALAANRERFGGLANLSFTGQDITQPLPFDDGAFGLVYAHLSLHYFADSVTKRVFGEVGRVLSAGGLLAFLCKSTDDPLYGQGIQVAPDMFEFGHTRHFFSEAYARACVSGGFDVLMVENRREELYGRVSATVSVIARKRPGVAPAR